MKQFLEITSLTERIVQKPDDMEKIIKPIDYSHISPRLDAFVEKSKQELINALNVLNPSYSVY